MRSHSEPRRSDDRDDCINAGRTKLKGKGLRVHGLSTREPLHITRKRFSSGLNLNWAYAPGELKVLVRADGANFDARTERKNTRGIEST